MVDGVVGLVRASQPSDGGWVPKTNEQRGSSAGLAESALASCCRPSSDRWSDKYTATSKAYSAVIGYNSRPEWVKRHRRLHNKASKG